MSVTKLLPTLQNLSRADKLRIMQFLISELAKEENEASLEDGKYYPSRMPAKNHIFTKNLREAGAESPESR